MKVLLVALVCLFFVICFVNCATKTIQPEPVTDPLILKRLNCEMHCKNELDDNTPDCQYRCMSDRCYRKIFRKLIGEDGLIEGTISEKLHKKFDSCFSRELQKTGEL
eukprot:TRINITY_DN73555_c0_g1_i1.p1 TRINITY_DN73555_c0_g1~~TRINITY_DN73555_c0_g1_i1.p1  ORF type:complete len:107 (+),score=12.99 TRINITY_DN73555_c0_g1_i1:23-343(+)